jgi:hypothetical protein
MTIQYLLPTAPNTVRGETVKLQDLTGTHLGPHQRAIAEELAQHLV